MVPITIEGRRCHRPTSIRVRAVHHCHRLRQTTITHHRRPARLLRRTIEGHRRRTIEEHRRTTGIDLERSRTRRTRVIRITIERRIRVRSTRTTVRVIGHRQRLEQPTSTRHLSTARLLRHPIERHRTRTVHRHRGISLQDLEGRRRRGTGVIHIAVVGRRRRRRARVSVRGIHHRHRLEQTSAAGDISRTGLLRRTIEGHRPGTVQVHARGQLEDRQ